MRDLLWRVCFRRKIWPAPGDRRHHLRHDREHRGPRGRRHPRLRPAARLRAPAAAVLRPGRRSPTTPSATSTAAPQDQPLPRETRQAHRGGRRLPRPMPRPATPARSRRTAPTSDHGRIVHRSLLRRLPRARCAATTPPRPTRRRCASGRSGSSRCSPKPRTGTACAGSGCAGLLNVNIQGLLIAAGQNLKRFLAATGWGRRHAPCGSLVALPREPRAALSRLRVMTDPAGDRSTGELDLEWSVTATPATGGFFQRPGPLSAPPHAHELIRIV